MKLAILGHGKMGRTIERLALEKGHTIVFKSSSSSSEGNIEKADVAIEFSTPEAAQNNLESCFQLGIPVVSGTTGWLEHYDEIIKLCEDSNGSFIYASNFSIGVNLFFDLNEKLAKMMRPWKDYNVSVSEIHHSQKKDAPSGTAISIAEGILKHSEKKEWRLDGTKEIEISISSERIDDVKGTHVVSYASEIDTISIKHEAHNRNGFAIGAILAAEWLQTKKGIFTMKDVLEVG